MNTPGPQSWVRKPGIVMLAIVIGGFALGYWTRAGRHGDPAAPTAQQGFHQASASAAPTAHEHKLYVCPMMDVPPMEQPGKCPVCGMELIEVSGGDPDAQGPPQLHLTPEAMKLAEIQVAPVEKKFVPAEIGLYGQIEYDPAHLSYVSAFMPGVINKVYVERIGVGVRWAQPLFDLYSAELYYTEQQFLEVAREIPTFLAFQGGTAHVARKAEVEARRPINDPNRKPSDETNEGKAAMEAAQQKLGAIRHKLAVLGISKTDIDGIMARGDATGIATVVAPRTGTIIEQKAFPGTYVNTGTPIFTIADSRYMWAWLDAYESDLPWLHPGQQVEFQTDAYPGEIFKGKVISIDPVFDPKTRTFKVGVICPDPKKTLRAQMVVRAVVHATITADGKVVNENTAPDRAPLVIPASAPLITGKRAVVYVESVDQPGTYEGREILLGPRAKDYYLVHAGLREGERVVVNGNFKIDSAIQILAKPSMMHPEGAVQPEAPPETSADQSAAFPAPEPEKIKPYAPGRDYSPWRGLR
jgi:Cu(I)/Ag(I) efflux system membrane fusion protein